MICPLKFNSVTLDKDGSWRIGSCDCEKRECGWWNERFEMCSIVVDAYLKGIEDRRRELGVLKPTT